MTLLSRVEALTGPDRAIDAELARMVGFEHLQAPYTASVDAALAFAEKVLPPGDAIQQMGRPPFGLPGRWRVELLDGSGATAKTLPLAIIRTVLRAKEGT
jgi:hypothetical protein